MPQDTAVRVLVSNLKPVLFFDAIVYEKAAGGRFQI